MDRDMAFIVKMIQRIHERLDDQDQNSYDNQLIQLFNVPKDSATISVAVSAVNTTPGTFQWGGYEGIQFSSNAWVSPVNDYVDSGVQTNLNLTSGLTIEALVYITSYDSAPCIVVNSDLNGGYFLSLGNNNGKIRAYVKSTNAYFETASSYVPLNTWTRITISQATNGNIRVFINGVFKEAGGSTPSGIVGSLVQMKGSIRLVRIYNRQLTDTEVNNNMTGLITRNGIAGEWLMTEGSGQTAKDTSGNGYHGNVVNGSFINNQAGFYWNYGGAYG